MMDTFCDFPGMGGFVFFGTCGIPLTLALLLGQLLITGAGYPKGERKRAALPLTLSFLAVGFWGFWVFSDMIYGLSENIFCPVYFGGWLVFVAFLVRTILLNKDQITRFKEEMNNTPDKVDLS